MRFWYTERVAYMLLLLSLTLPYFIMYQYLSDDNYTIVMLGALWQYIFSKPDYVYFVVSPVGLVYILWYGPSVYIAKVAYDAAKKGGWSRHDYTLRVVLVVIIQVLITLIIPPASGYPPPTIIPLPISGIIALIFARWTVKDVTEVWDDHKDEDAFNSG